MIYEFRRSGRSPTVAAVVLGYWAVLLVAVVAIEMALWIAVPLGLFALPAVWDFVQARESGLTLSEVDLHWFSGAVETQVARADVDKVRIDRRLDLSHRVTVVLTDGRGLRLPPDATPPVPAFEAALETAGIPFEKHPFSLMQ